VLQKDYYHVLCINRNASEDEIKRAYRKLALKYHPDHHPDDPEREEIFKEVGEAYSVLSDLEKRKEYDQFGHGGFKRRYTSQDIFRNFDFDELFKEFGVGFETHSFRGFSCGRRGRGCGWRKANFFRGTFFQEFLERGEIDEICELPLTPGEAYRGTEKQIIIDRVGEQQRFFIQVPPGIKPGTLLRVVLSESKDGEILLRVRII